MGKLLIKFVRLVTIHNIASYSLSVAECQGDVKGINNLIVGWAIAHLACRLSVTEANLGVSSTIVRGVHRVVDS